MLDIRNVDIIYVITFKGSHSNIIKYENLKNFRKDERIKYIIYIVLEMISS